MPTASVSNSSCKIQITWSDSKRRTIVHMVRSVLGLLPALMAQLLMECQRRWLQSDLGPYGTVGNLFGTGRMACPDCGSVRANRRNWRVRSWVVPVLGEIECPLRWVDCRDCGRSWTPYKGTLGIQKQVQYSPEVMVDHLREALQTTYKKASETESYSPGSMTLWRRMIDWVPEGEGQKRIDKTVLVDATKVPKHKESGQWMLTMAQGVAKNKAGWEREVLAGVVGREVDMKEELDGYDIQRLMHDGQLDVDELCEQEGRCSWHVPHTVRLLLHRDGVHGKDNKRRWYWLHSIVWDRTSSLDQWEQRLEEWIRANEDSAPIATSHVRHAKEGLRTVREHPEAFGMRTNSLMEREMVEINKRFENGGGWSKHGGQALLKHFEFWRHEPETWEREVRSNAGASMPSKQQNSQT